MKPLIFVLLSFSLAFSQSKEFKADEELLGATSIDARINLGLVEMQLRRTEESGKAFKVDYSYPQESKPPELYYEVSYGKGYFRFSNDHNSVSLFGLKSRKNNAYIELSRSVPLSLELNLGVCNGNIDLGGMKLRRADISTGVSSLHLNFSEPNQIRAEVIRIKGGVSSIDVSNLANANASRIEYSGGVGSAKLDFGGKLQGDCSARIETGLGSIEILVPGNMSVTIRTPESFLTGIDVQGFFSEGKGIYRSKETGGPHLDIRIESAFGSVSVKAY
ncbi:MAG: hypothetical protein ACP5US_09235 [Candidatus Kryptoniota bacterium]